MGVHARRLSGRAQRAAVLKRCTAALGEFDELDLRMVVEAWSRIPSQVKAGIVAMVWAVGR